MGEMKGTIEIGRPVEEVFNYLAELKNTVEWESGVEEMELTSEGPIEVGSKGRRVWRGDEYIWEVTAWKPNEMAALKYESDRFTGDGEWTTEPTDGGTRVTHRFRGSAKNPFLKLLAPLMTMMINRTAKKNYQTLKGILESRS